MVSQLAPIWFFGVNASREALIEKCVLLSEKVALA